MGNPCHQKPYMQYSSAHSSDAKMLVCQSCILHPASYMLRTLSVVGRLASQWRSGWCAASTCLHYSTVPGSEPHQICVVGSGPAGCYAVDRVSRNSLDDPSSFGADPPCLCISEVRTGAEGLWGRRASGTAGRGQIMCKSECLHMLRG
jgi:hypothetical protein